MIKIYKAFALLSLTLTLTACIEDTTTIKVHKDGKGQIEISSHSRTNKMLKNDSGATFDKTLFEDIAQKMGTGVTLDSVEENTNLQGFGYSATFSFEDISQVEIFNLQFASSTTSNDGETVTAVKISDSSQSKLTFKLEGDVLNVMQHNIKDPNQGTKNPSESDDAILAKLKSLKPTLDGSGEYLTIELLDPVKSTNAKHFDDNKVLLKSVDLKTIVEHVEKDIPKFRKAVDNKQVADWPGFKQDSQESVEIKFQ